MQQIITYKYNTIKERKDNFHEIYFYKDKKGKEPVADYLAELAKKEDNDSRIKLNKIRDYVKVLSEYGT